MKKTMICLLILAVMGYMAFAASAKLELPNSLSATLSDSINQSDVSILVYNEQGALQTGETTTIEFTFPTDRDAWEVSHIVTFAYSSNLFNGKRGFLSFDVTPLQRDAANIVDTALVLETSNPDVHIVNGNEFSIDFNKGYQGEVLLGSVTITARKPAGQVLQSGEYIGSISVNLTSSN